MNQSASAAAVAGYMLLAACGQQPVQKPPSNKIEPPALAAPAAKIQAKDRKVEEKSDILEFAYGWPAEAAAIEPLNGRFEAELARDKAEALDTAKADMEARSADAPYSGHSFSKLWESYGQSSRLLSLAAEIGTFTGGAHGNATYDTLLWDRRQNRAIKVADLFIDPEQAWETLSRPYCEGLDKGRAERRQESLPLKGDDWMVACPPMAEQALLPLDRDHGRFESFLVLLAPYAAGPYAEGSYEVEVAVTDEIRRMIKPEYRDAF